MKVNNFLTFATRMMLVILAVGLISGIVTVMMEHPQFYSKNECHDSIVECWPSN